MLVFLTVDILRINVFFEDKHSMWEVPQVSRTPHTKQSSLKGIILPKQHKVVYSYHDLNFSHISVVYSCHDLNFSLISVVYFYQDLNFSLISVVLFHALWIETNFNKYSSKIKLK